MTVRLWPLVVIPGASFGGWDAAFSNANIASAGKNNCQAVSDTTLRRYAGIRFPGVSINCLESSTKAAPTVWAVPTVMPVAALGILDIWALPGVSPDTLLCATVNPADGRLWRFILGTGWTNLAFPDGANSDAVVCVGPTQSDADLFLVGNQCRNVAGSAQLWTFRLSTVTWTKIGGTGLNGSWNYVNNNSTVSNTIAANGFIYVTVGNGSANGFQVWRTADTGATWTKIGGDGLNGSWAAANKRNGKAFLATNGKLYLGIGGAAGNAEAWECTNPGGASPSWVKIGDSTQWTSATITNASEIAGYANKIVVGTSGSVAGDSQAWEYDTQTGLWVQLAVGTWNRTNTGCVYVSPFDQKLFIGVGNNSTGTVQLFERAASGSNPGGMGMHFFPAPVKVMC